MRINFLASPSSVPFSSSYFIFPSLFWKLCFLRDRRTLQALLRTMSTSWYFNKNAQRSTQRRMLRTDNFIVLYTTLQDLTGLYMIYQTKQEFTGFYDFIGFYMTLQDFTGIYRILWILMNLIGLYRIGLYRILQYFSEL